MIISRAHETSRPSGAVMAAGAFTSSAAPRKAGNTQRRAAKPEMRCGMRMMRLETGWGRGRLPIIFKKGQIGLELVGGKGNRFAFFTAIL